MRAAENVLVVDDDAACRYSERGEESERNEEQRSSHESEKQESDDRDGEIHASLQGLHRFFRNRTDDPRSRGYAFSDFSFRECFRIADLRPVLHEDGQSQIGEDPRSVKEEKEDEQESDEKRIDVEFFPESRAYAENHSLRAVAVERRFHVPFDRARDFGKAGSFRFRSVGENVFGFSEFVHDAYRVRFRAFGAHVGEFFREAVFYVLRVFAADAVGVHVSADAFEIILEERFGARGDGVPFSGDGDGGHGFVVNAFRYFGFLLRPGRVRSRRAP